jgi:hypothetical protein
VSEVGLRRLRVVVSSVADGTAWRPNSQFSAVKLIARSISIFSRFVHDLIEGWEDVISELHLSNGGRTCSRHANSEASDTLLGEGRVEDAISAVFLIEVHSAAEHASKLDILAENDGRVVCLERQVERVPNRGVQIHVDALSWLLKLELLNVQGIRKVVLLQLILDQAKLAEVSLDHGLSLSLKYSFVECLFNHHLFIIYFF